MKHEFWAHGECSECGFVGDMYYVKDGKFAICPECNCEVDAEAMPDFPGHAQRKDVRAK